MARSARYAPRRAHVPYWFIVAAVFGGFIAVLPIAAAVFRQVPNVATPRTAFATAPSGAYVVVARSEAQADVISVAPAADPAAAMAVARVPHLPGYASNGSVSPEGRRLALVTSDGGTPSRPTASLLVLDLETGLLVRLASAVDPLQTPLWTLDGAAVIVSRSVDGEGPTTVRLFKVSAGGGGEQPLWEAPRVLGAYAVGFDTSGRFVLVAIDQRGSTLYRDGVEGALLSRQITRDWRLSDDGAQIAFVEADLTDGLHYRARVTSLDGGGVSISAQAASGEAQQLGVAWKPGAAAPTFGDEPALPSPGSVTAQALTAGGFDVPLGYSADGGALAVEHWTGTSFANPGQVELAIVTGAGRATLSGFTRYFGWAVR